ncbi:hypothetical protein RvY_01819 [Ramazzottius varieornatus]|uniref:Uncharacterized protein n=1 Tax=Ramazzottius varieornatus TaxID=947166 RepID=A0A1D1UPQ6_RAMVA|nr:hypothetical protein RvY_01819 [Ramazzottius varieornatus]
MLKTLIKGTSTVNFYNYVDFLKHISGLVLCIQTYWTSRSTKLEVRYRPLKKIFSMSSRLACRRSISWKSLSLKPICSMDSEADFESTPNDRLTNLLQVEQNLLPMRCLYPESRIRKWHQTRLLILPTKNVLLVTGPMSLPRSVVAWAVCRTSLGKLPVLAS